jgi:uncharacterized membrane protein
VNGLAELGGAVDDDPREATRASEATTSRLLGVGVCLAVAGGLLILGGHVLNAIVLDDRFFELSARSEGNAFTWLSTSAAFGGALAAALHALLIERHRWRFAVMAVAFAHASLDDFIILHERLGQALYTDALGLSKELSSRLEILSVMPLLAAGFLAAWSVSGVMSTRIGRVLRAGLVTLAVAVALELVAGSTRLLLDGPLAWIDEIRIGTEEGTELAGWTVVATALIAALCVSLIELGGKSREARG